MSAQEPEPCVKGDRSVTIVIVAASRKDLDQAVERYFRKMHPARHLVRVDEQPFEKDGSWKIVLKRSKCQ